MGVCNCSMFCFTLLYGHSSIAIILMGKRELIALLNLSSWCLVMVEQLFLAVLRGCLQFVIEVFPDHTHLLFLTLSNQTLRHKFKRIRICLILLHKNNNLAYQSSHLQSRIKDFVCPLETYEHNMINADIQYSSFLLAEQVCLSLTCMHIQNT